MSNALESERGQSMLRELATVLDTAPVKRLSAGSWKMDGECCALGMLILSRDPDPDSFFSLSILHFGSELAGEVVSANDKFLLTETPEQRFTRMRAWVASQIKEPA